MNGNPLSYIDPLGLETPSVSLLNAPVAAETTNIYDILAQLREDNLATLAAALDGDPEAAVEVGLGFVGAIGSIRSIKAATQCVKKATQAVRPRGIPKDWVAQAGKKEGHTKFVNPTNSHDYVRVKPDGTVTQVRNGKAFDVNGNPVDLRSPEAHGITSDKFVFRE